MARTCAHCKADIPKNSSYFQDIPGLGDLCKPCHEKWLAEVPCETCGATDCCEERSNGFSAGDYANSYISTSLEDAEVNDLEDKSEAYRAAFVLGFFATYELDEIPSDAREAFDEAYHSEHGQSVLKHGYTDSRDDDYKTEQENF